AALLQIDIRKADLKPGSVTLTPSDPSPGQITAITIEVLNSGDIDASPVVVAFYDNGQYIGSEELSRVAAGSKGYVTFAWLPTAGPHNLRFIIDPTSGPNDLIGRVVESDELNNVAIPAKDPYPVGNTTNLPGFEAPLLFAAIGAMLLASRV